MRPKPGLAMIIQLKLLYSSNQLVNLGQDTALCVSDSVSAHCC